MSDTMCRSGDSHYAGCACHEARWTEKLAIAEAASRPVFSRRMLEAKLAASEERVRGLEEGLYQIESHVAGFAVGSWESMLYGLVRAALAPPLEAEKKGGDADV